MPSSAMDRIATFKSFIARTPSDPFPRYGLAMEHKTRGEHEQAWAVFEGLLQQFPDYVPTYLMAGGTLAALGRTSDAADVYRRGIDVATRRGQSPEMAHARRELESALGELAPMVGSGSASLNPK